MNAIIKRATPKHCFDIIKICREGQLFEYNHFFYALLVALGWAYVAVIEDQVVGYICYLNFPIISRAFLLQVGVTKSYRGQGLGSKLINDTCNKIKRKYRVETVMAHTLKPRVVKLFNRQRWSIITSILGVFLVAKKIR